MSAPLDVRPVPIQDAFKSVTGTTQFLASVASMLVGFGVLAAARAAPSWLCSVVEPGRKVRLPRAERPRTS